MKKNIAIAILAIGFALAVVFGIYKNTEAHRQEALAVANAAEAIKQRDLAEMAMNEAEMQRRLAEEHIAIAAEALENCRKQK